MKVFLDLMWFFKQEKKQYLLGIMLIIGVASLELVPPYVIGLIIDHIEGNTLTKLVLFRWILLLLVMAILVYILRFWWRVMIFGSAIKLARLLRNNLFSHFTAMSSQFYQRRRIGDLMAHATNDLQAIQQTAGIGVLTLVDSITTGGFVLIAMAVIIDWKLTLISLLPMPIMAYATGRYGKMLHKRFHKAQQAFSILNDKVQESISGIKVIKTFGQEKQDSESFQKLSKDVVNKNISVAKIDALFDPTISLIVGISFFLAVSVGSNFVLNGRITIGELVAFTGYLGLLIWPMLAFGWLFNIVERGRASYDRVSSLLAEVEDIQDREGAVVKEVKGDILYNIDYFHYPGEKSPTLSSIKFSIKEGQTIGIVGKTGSGKTTLIRLLLREFDVSNGEIFIGGTNIQSYQKESLRKGIGYVPQDHFLFSATISDNIAFARADAPFHKIVQAAKDANIHSDILLFSEGYETMVGERGVTLSGGQRQRLSIARALLVNPPILLLDDSLSAVDATTEEIILSNLRENRKGKTTLISAHRLTAIEHADRIFVLDEGKIVEEGRHEDLMKKKGWYYNTYKRQQLEAIVEHGG